MSWRALLWTCGLVLVLGALAPREVKALDPLGLDAAMTEVQLALERMASALNAAPRRVQVAIGADLHLTSRAVIRTLNRLDSDVVPIVDPSLVYDLNLLADIARAATGELNAIGTTDAVAPDPERVARTDRLVDAASERLVEINLVIDGWTERSRNAVVELQEDDGVLVVRSTDRLVYDGVRYTSMALLLVGLLTLGLQLLRMSEDRVDWLALLRETPVLSSLAAVALAMFFVGCAVFSARPGTLAALSAEVRQQPQEHPCERLAAQRERLVAAQQVDHARLIAATKQRMQPAAQDCLGLPSDAATAEAIELLAAKTVATWSAPRLPQPTFAAAVAAEPDATAADLALLSLPAEAAEPAAADGGASGAAAAADQPAEDAAAAAADPRAQPPPAPGRDRDQTAALEPPSGSAPVQPAPKPPPSEALPDGDLSGSVPEIRPAAAPGPLSAADRAPADAPALESELYVTTTAVNYRAGPSLDARRLGTFVLGAELQVVSEDGGWAEIRLRDGREVYVASQFLEQAR
jgi:Bacterial SH3 domain